MSMMTLCISDLVQLKSHYSLHIADERCVYFFSESSSYVLNGRVYTLLIPLISSRAMSIEDIIVNASNKISPEYILYAANLLLEEGLIETGQVSGDEESVFWESNGITRNDARINMAHRCVNILSFGLADSLVGDLESMLEGLGFKSDLNNPAALTMLMTSDYLRSDLAEKIDDLSARDIEWMVVKPAGDKVWVGPSSAKGNVC